MRGCVDMSGIFVVCFECFFFFLFCQREEEEKKKRKAAATVPSTYKQRVSNTPRPRVYESISLYKLYHSSGKRTRDP